MIDSVKTNKEVQQINTFIENINNLNEEEQQEFVEKLINEIDKNISVNENIPDEIAEKITETKIEVIDNPNEFDDQVFLIEKKINDVIYDNYVNENGEWQITALLSKPKTGNWFTRTWDSVKGFARNTWNAIKSVFVKEKPKPTVIEMDNGEYYTVPKEIWDIIMTPDIAKALKAESDYTCFKFFKSALEQFGDNKELYNIIISGLKGKVTNDFYHEFKDNPNLVPFDIPDPNDLSHIQNFVDNGGFAFVIFKNDDGSGHIAFIAPSYLKYYSALEDTVYEGKQRADLGNHHLTVIQGGVFPGINSIVYATNDWNITSEREKRIINDMTIYKVRRD